MSGPAHNAARHALAAALLFLPGCAAVHVAGDVAEAGGLFAYNALRLAGKVSAATVSASRRGVANALAPS